MKAVYLVILGVIVSAFDSSAIVVAKKFDKPNEDDYETKFTDLDPDCMFLILDHLDLTDLLSMAQINDKFSRDAADVFRLKYSEILLDVGSSTLPNDPNEVLKVAGMEIDIATIKRVNAGYEKFIDALPTREQGRIKISNGDQILDTFKHFGHAIKKLKVTNERNSERVMLIEFIGKLISKYSFEALVDVELGYNAMLVLDYMENPLINVENVTFEHNEVPLENLTIAFNRLFPSVRRLDMGYIYDRSLVYFDYHLPHLEHILMDRSPNMRVENLPFPGVISKNTQIRSLYLYEYDPEFAKTVSTLLPQLETFSLFMYKPLNERIQFEKVTTLELSCPPTNMNFPKLENLLVEFSDDFFAEFCTFLDKCTHLTKLHLIFYTEIREDSNFQRLTATLPALNEITLENDFDYHGVGSATIVNFLKRNGNVQKLNFINCPDQQKVELQELLENEWHIIVNDFRLSLIGQIAGVDMFFERKTNDQV